MIWTRRKFLTTASAGAFLGALGIAGARPLEAATRLREFHELRRGAGFFVGQGGTIGWLVNADGCVVVDSQFPESAQECVDGLEARTSFPLDALVNTHHHGDHTSGNGVLGSVARTIVAHERVPELQRQAAQDPDQQTYADETFQERWSLTVGDETITARHYGPAHTGGDATIRFEEADVVHMGDLVFNRLHPFIDRGGGASARGWIQLLEAVAADAGPETLFIFGHGLPDYGVTGNREDVLVQRDYLDALLEAATEAAQAGRSRDEAVILDELPGFPEHQAPSPNLTLERALGAAYDEVTEGG